jgi:TonB family protein
MIFKLKKMKKRHLISLMLFACLGCTVYGQEPDTAKFGNIVINSEPIEVQVEIPSLGINNSKTDKALIIEFIPPAKYLIRVTSKKRVLEYEINVKPEKESHLFFNLRKKSVTLTEYEFRTISKDSNQHDDDNEVFTVVEEQPYFPGGDDARHKFIEENIHYPDSAVKNKIQGKVFVTFIVEKDGSLSNVRVLKGIGGGLDEEAVRVIKMMPKWIPGRQRGTPVRVQFNVPIKFILWIH